MTTTRLFPGVMVAVIGALSIALARPADSPGVPGKAVPIDKKPGPDDGNRVSVAEARSRAKIVHEIYASSLDTMHHHYFRREGAVLPARAMEDVFADVRKKLKIQARWIAVNTPAMSIHHEPETEFEKKAAAAISSGQAEFDLVEKGDYLHAGAIPLGAGCVGCHTKFASAPNKTPRFAGLVIVIPVRSE